MKPKSKFELNQKKIKEIIKKFGVKPGRSRFGLMGTESIHWNVWFDACVYYCSTYYKAVRVV